MKLNIGCGNKHISGFINADIVEPADILFDVTKGIPYKDDNFDEVQCDNLLEHLDADQFKFVINEIHRVLQKGGKLWLRVPDAENWFAGAFGDFTHKHFFCLRSFCYWEKGHQTYENYGKSYGIKPWKTISLTTDKKFITWEGTAFK